MIGASVLADMIVNIAEILLTNDRLPNGLARLSPAAQAIVDIVRQADQRALIANNEILVAKRHQEKRAKKDTAGRVTKSQQNVCQNEIFDPLRVPTENKVSNFIVN